MAVRVQVPPSAPNKKGAMTLSFCSLCLFCLPENLRSPISVCFGYQNEPILVSSDRKLVRVCNFAADSKASHLMHFDWFFR